MDVTWTCAAAELHRNLPAANQDCPVYKNKPVHNECGLRLAVENPHRAQVAMYEARYARKLAMRPIRAKFCLVTGEETRNHVTPFAARLIDLSEPEAPPY